MILVVVPSAPDGAAAVSPARVVAGLPLLTRIVRAATAAGYEHVFVRDAGPATRDLLGGTGAVVLTSSTPLPPLSKRRIVAVAANVVPQSRWLRALLEMPIEPERLYVDGACAMAVETERAGEVLARRPARRAPPPSWPSSATCSRARPCRSPRTGGSCSRRPVTSRRRRPGSSGA